ncbi:MAG: hypothetical protein AAB316_23380, partial [Bacteroidota bacterium]
MENFLLGAYASQTKGRSPLDVPKRTVAIALGIALIAGIALSNLFLQSLQIWNLANLDSAKILVPQDSTEEAVKSLLTPDLHPRVRRTQISPALDALVSDGSITFRDAQLFLEETYQGDDYRLGIAGKLKRELLVMPRFESDLPSKVLGGQKISLKSDKLNEKQLNYAAAVGLINAFREELGTGYGSPRRLLQALGDYIQFITFILAIWGILLVTLRHQWRKLQLRLTLDGYLRRDAASGQNIWAFLDTPSGKAPLLVQYQENYGEMLVPVQLLGEAAQMKESDKPAVPQTFVNDRIDLMEASVAKGEYQLLDWIAYAIPNLGFLGTILGIIMSMAN